MVSTGYTYPSSAYMVSEYKKIKSTGLIGIFGSLNKDHNMVQDGSFSIKKIINYKEENLPMDIIMGQLTSPVDFNNIIILFTIGGRYGTNRFFGKEQILSDHCTYSIPVKEVLHKHGVKFKNDVSLKSQKYSQRSIMMLIVQNGIAYSVKDNGDPTSRLAWSENHEVDLDMTDEVTIEDKNIMFSGFFVERFRK